MNNGMDINKRYLLTISIPTYNGSRTIGRMLEILLPQCDDRVEILISDNASTDMTGVIVQNYKDRFPQIRYIKNDVNIGPDSNFLQCMMLANGKYTLLLSDDDILVENSLATILRFLAEQEEMSLVYLNAVGFHENYVSLGLCKKFGRAIYDGRTFATTDKKEFMDYAGRMWGFLSCFICLTDIPHAIKDAEGFKKTNWLQSYIHILCAEYGKKKLGVISIPCIGAGIYSILSNCDSGRVDGISYKTMLEFAIAHGFDRKQLTNLYIWRICFIFKRTLIKERASGIRKSQISNVIKYTWMYPKVWIQLYPFFLIPPFLCKFIVAANNKRRGYQNKAEVNRQGDVVG